MRTLRRLIRDESGFSLIMAMGILAVLSTAGATLIFYSNSNARSSHYAKNSTTAYDLAEAGVNRALAVLYNQNSLDPNILPATTEDMQGGTVTWSGSFNQLSSPALWTITSTATTPNPTGGTDITRTVTATVPVTLNVTGSLVMGAWNYIYTSNKTTGCDVVLDQSVNFQSPLYVSGNLCMNTPSSVSAGPLIVHGSVHLDVNTNIGTSGSPISLIQIGGETALSSYSLTGCQSKSNTKHFACKNGASPNPATRNGDDIWKTGLAQSTTASPVDLPSAPPTYPAPVADFVNWYNLASPGPKIACATSSGVPGNGTGSWATGFDTDGIKNRNAPLFDLIPSSSYSCVTAGGELSWNATTQVLTIKGVVYIDGDAKMDRNIGVVEYNGQGALFLSGTFQLQNAKLCAVKSGSNCDWNAWNPANEMFAIVADGTNGPSPMPTNDSVFLRSTQFQGALYATSLIEFDTSTETMAPMIGDTVVNGNSVITRPFTTPINVPVGLPGQPVVSPGVPGTPTILPD